MPRYASLGTQLPEISDRENGQQQEQHAVRNLGYGSVLVLVFGDHIWSGEKRSLVLARHQEVFMRIAIIGAGEVAAVV